nr:hypothetical protein [Acidobacteriota bacterium]NIQ87383.1 hypothetical protein [Acidobacteriota bacterium]
MRATVLRLYVAAIVAAAGIAVALLPTEGMPADLVALSLLALLSIIAGARPVRFVGKGNEITATHSTIICGLAVLGAPAALVIAVAGLISTLVIRRRRPKVIRSVFNFAGIMFSTAMAAHVFFTLGGAPG